MKNHVQKTSNRVWAMVLAIVMIIGMLPVSVFAVAPSTVSTDLGGKAVTAGESVEFTVTTAANDDLGKMVFGYFDFNGGDWSAIESLQYKESQDGNWYDLPQGAPFGPVGVGFPMSDATSTFRVKFAAAGTYGFSVSMRTVEDNTELCALNQQVAVKVKPSELVTDVAEKSFVVGTPEEFTVSTVANGHAGEYVFGKFSFSDWDAVEKLEYWGVTENQWMPLPKDVLFGPADTGFPMTNATTRLQVTFNKAGTYTCAVDMVKASDTNAVLSSVKKEITVTETIPPVVETISGNPADWAKVATITGTVSDLGGSGVVKVVYSTKSAYADTHTAANLVGEVFSFGTTENTTYYVWAVDGNGNISEARSIEINKIDLVAPVLDVQATPNKWTNGDVKIAITASDEHGVTVKYNSSEDYATATEVALSAEGTAEITVSGEYNGDYYVWAEDTAGNRTAKQVAVKIDTIKPTVAITTVPSAVWTNGDVTIEGTVADVDSAIGANSGVNKVVFGTELENAKDAALADDNKYSFAVAANGTYNIWAKDAAGNFSELAAITIQNIDKIAPTVDAAAILTDGVSRVWWNTDLTVGGSVSDLGGSGIAKVVYSTENVYSKDLPVAALQDNGEYSFNIPLCDYNGNYYIWAVDVAGNVSAEAKPVKIQMDATNPVVSEVVAATNEWTNDKITVTVTAEDNNTVAKVVYNATDVYSAEKEAAKNEDGTFSFVVENDQEFNGNYYVWVIDEAGNVSELTEQSAVQILIDITAPTVDEIKADPAVATNQNVTVSGKVSDLVSTTANSGVQKVVYSTDSKYGAALNEATLNEDGTYSFVVENTVEFNGKYYVWAIDNAGNHTEKAAEVNVHIDTTSAKTTIEISKGAWHEFLNTITFGLYYKEGFTVTIEADDGDSGVASIHYFTSNVPMTLEEVEKVEESTWSSYSKAFEISEEQYLIVYTRTVDKAGNVQYFSSDGIVLDATAAIIELSPSAPAADNGVKDIYGYYNDDVTIGIKVTDAEPYSGIKSIKYWVTKYIMNGDEVVSTAKTQEKLLYNFGYDGSYDAAQTWEIFDVNEGTTSYTGIPTKAMLKNTWETDTDTDIVIEAEKNNSCKVVVTVEVIDNASNVTIEEVTLDIDKTAPTVEVSYEDEGKQYNGKYYDGNRTATIEITERSHHFVAPNVYINPTESVDSDPNCIVITSKDAKGNAVAFAPNVEWVPTVNAEDPDKTVYTATIEDDVDANYTFDIRVQDKAMNVNEAVIVDETAAPFDFTVDKVNPEGTLQIETYSPWDEVVKSLTFGIYAKEILNVIATAKDETSPIKVEYYKASGAEATKILDMENITGWIEVDQSKNPWIPAVGASEQFVIYLRITDNANHVYYVSTDGALVEEIAPIVTLTPSAPAADNGDKDVYGYYNDDVTIGIEVTDAEPYSGIKSVKYWVTKCIMNGDEVVSTAKTQEKLLYNFGYDGSYDAAQTWEIVDINEETTSYTGIPTKAMLKNEWKTDIVVDAEKNNSCNVVVTVEVTDNAGNVTIEEVKLDIDDKEQTVPTVEVSYIDEGTQHNGKYYNGNRTATIEITERSHHFVAPNVYINPEESVDSDPNCIVITAVDGLGKPVVNEKNEAAFAPAIEWVPTVNAEDTDKTVYTATIKYDVDANYTFDIRVQDKAMNVNEKVSVDETAAPFEFTVDKMNPTGSVTISTSAPVKETWDKILEVLTFGHYDATKIDVTAAANDITSPVKVEYYKHTGAAAATPIADLENHKDWTLLIDNGKCVVDETDVLKVEAYEQFVVYLKLTDYAGNIHYIRSGGAILDNVDPEVKEVKAEITLDPQQPVNEIYNTDVKIDVKVEEIAVDDVYSGLKSVTYEIFNHSVSDTEPSQKGTLLDFTNKTPTQTELIPNYEELGAITVDKTLNNSNDVEVKVLVEDNAGNKTEKSISLKIDITDPTINITYNNNAPDSGKYYKDERVATIVVTERNFDAKDVITRITNTDGVIPTISGWSTAEGTGNKDNTTHTATITYSADGDYTFDIDYTDLAGNACAGETFAGGTQNPTEFTIDRTNPVIRVAYDNNQATNGNYFNATRTATVTITEHNFTVDRVIFTQTSGRGGVTPSPSWSSSGDTHTATFSYTTDGDYTFDVTMTDMAGNESGAADFGDSVAGQDFIVDTTFEEMITIGGVENGKAYGYNATVVPTININDINLEKHIVTLVGVQKDKTIDLTEKVNALLNVGTETVSGSFDVFKVVQDMDGIYTLKVTSQDKAGNLDEEEIIFTVNRFGSVYVYDQYLVDLIANGGTYVKSVTEDLVIMEYNADKLVPNSLVIEITCDGKPLDNVFYDVTPEINNTVAVGESGWYQYKYTISKDNFTADGVYKISVSSKDATGNTPENNRYEDLGITFRVDSTLAEISSIVGLEEPIINATEQVVKYTVYDTMGIKSIKVYVDGQLVDEITDFSADLNNYSGSFTLTEQSAAQSIRIVVEDMSGNITDTDAETFSSAYEFNKSVTVSTNIFVRWYANKPLFWGSIGGTAVVAGGLWLFLAAKRKKKEEANA